MSNCGGIVVACLAAPLLLVVLLVAGVSYLALEAAKLTGRLALEGVQFAGTVVAQSVRLASDLIQRSAASASMAVGGSATLFDSAGSIDRLRSAARRSYQDAMTALDAASILTLDPHRPSPTSETAMGTGGVASTDSARHLLARARAIEASLLGELPLRLVAEQRSSEVMATAKAALNRAELFLCAGDVQAAQADAQRAEALLSVTVRDAHDRLVSAERTTIAATVGNAMTDLGYEIRAAATTGRTAVVGRKNQHTVALVIGEAGRIDLDMAGYDGDACDHDVHALIAELRRHGLTISETHFSRHGCPEGGALIRTARSAGTSLERALAETILEPAQPAAAGDTEPVRRVTRRESRASAPERAVAWLWGTNSATGGRQ